MDNFPARIPIPPFLSSSFLFLLLRVGRSSIYVAFIPCIDWKREEVGGQSLGFDSFHSAYCICLFRI